MHSLFAMSRDVMRRHAFKVVIYIALSLTLGLQSLAIPYITGNFIDCLNTSADMSGIYRYCNIYFGVAVIGIIGGYINNRLNINILTRMSYDLNKSVIEHIQRIGLTAVRYENTAELNQKVNNDSNAVISFCVSVIQGILKNVLTIAVALYVMIRLENRVLIIAIASIPIYAIIFFLIRRAIYEAGKELKNAQTVFFGKMYEQLSYIKQIKINGLVKGFTKRMDRYFPDLMKSAYKYQDVSYLFSSIDTVVMSLAQVGLFLYCGYAVISKRMTIGQLTLVSSYFGMFIGAVRYFFSLGKTVQDTKISEARLREIIEVPEEENGTTELSGINRIKSSDLSLAIGPKKIFSDINIDLEKGKIYVLEGENGRGKTSLALSLIGLYNPEISGGITYNDSDLSELDMYKARQGKVVYLEQEPRLFDDSILYNITLGQEHYDSKRMEELAETFNIRELIEGQPEGWNTATGGSDTTFSGGEKQKMMLVRTFLNNPELVILDEPSSALDAGSTQALCDYLKSTGQERITVIITHDEIFKNIADKVLTM